MKWKCYLLLLFIVCGEIKVNAQDVLSKMYDDGLSGTKSLFQYYAGHNANKINQAMAMLRSISSQVDHYLNNPLPDKAAFDKMQTDIANQMDQALGIFKSGNPTSSESQSYIDYLTIMVVKAEKITYVGDPKNPGGSRPNSGFGSANDGRNSPAGKSPENTLTPNYVTQDILNKVKDFENAFGNSKITLSNSTGDAGVGTNPAAVNGVLPELNFDNVSLEKSNPPASTADNPQNTGDAVKQANDDPAYSGSGPDQKSDIDTITALVGDPASATKIVDLLTQPDDPAPPAASPDAMADNVAGYYQGFNNNQADQGGGLGDKASEYENNKPTELEVRLEDGFTDARLENPINKYVKHNTAVIRDSRTNAENLMTSFDDPEVDENQRDEMMQKVSPFYEMRKEMSGIKSLVDVVTVIGDKVKTHLGAMSKLGVLYFTRPDLWPSPSDADSPNDN